MLSKCSNCGSSREYDPEKKKLVCPNCKSEAEEIAVKDRTENTCPECGAPQENADKKVTYRCPYCHNWIILENKLEGPYSVKKIMPFTMGRKKAMGNMKTAFDNIPFMPNDFISSEREKDLKGVYVPFFLYDVEAKGEYKYTGEMLNSWDTGNTTYTKHDVYDIDRPYSGVVSAPIDASDEINDDIVDALAPFDNGDMEEFNTKYLPGFEMHIFDKNPDSEEYKKRAIDWADVTVQDALEDSVTGFTGIGISSKQGDLNIKEHAYTYRPLYVYDYKYGKKSYQVYLNGTNDRVSGIAPIDKKKLTAHYIFEIVCAIIGAVSLVQIFALLI